MCAKGVVLNGASPVVVLHFGSLLGRADTVHPVIFVGKAATGPAQHGYLQGFERLKNIIAIALGVGDV